MVVIIVPISGGCLRKMLSWKKPVSDNNRAGERATSAVSVLIIAVYLTMVDPERRDEPVTLGFLPFPFPATAALGQP